MARGKKTGGRQKGASDKATFEQNGERVKTANISSQTMSKSSLSLVLQKGSQGKSAKEQLEELAAMVKPIFTDRCSKAVKYDENGKPMLTVDGDLQFETSALAGLGEWAITYQNILKSLAPYQSATFEAMDVGLTVSAPLGQMREMEATARPKPLTLSQGSSDAVGSSEQASLEPHAAFDRYRRVIKGLKM